MIASTHILDILEQADIKPPHARAITKAFEEAEKEIVAEVKKESDEKSKQLATKGDLAELRATTKEDIAKLRATTKEDIAELRATTKEDIAELRAELHAVKAELIRWTFLFWIGLIPVMILIVKYVR